MLKKYKSDLKTIIELLVYLGAGLLCPSFFRNYPWIQAIFVSLAVGRFLYWYYVRKTNKKDMVTYPTQSEEFSKMTYFSFGILLGVFGTVYYIAYDLRLLYLNILYALAAILLVLGSFKPPAGWLSISDNSVKLYGVSGQIDARLIKEIILKNDKIILIDIFDEIKSNTLLKLDVKTAGDIITFVNEKLAQPITIKNEVN